MLASDFPAENPRTQTRTILIRKRYPTFKKIWLFIEIKKNYDKNRIEKGLYELTLLECNFYADGLNSDATFI